MDGEPPLATTKIYPGDMLAVVSLFFLPAHGPLHPAFAPRCNVHRCRRRRLAITLHRDIFCHASLVANSIFENQAMSISLRPQSPEIPEMGQPSTLQRRIKISSPRYVTTLSRTNMTIAPEMSSKSIIRKGYSDRPTSLPARSMKIDVIPAMRSPIRIIIL